MKKRALPMFGCKFPPEYTMLQRHTYCAVHNRGNGSFWHRKEIMRAYWPEEVYRHSAWSDARLKSTCDNLFVTWIGSGGAGKSTDAAGQGLEWWLEAPEATSVIMCSTTKEMLRTRIWSEVVRLHSALPGAIEFREEDGTLLESIKIPWWGKILDSETRVQWKSNDVKHAIFGKAIGDGPVNMAVQDLVGIHPAWRYWLIIDEMQGCREAIMGALPNMSKNQVFKFLGMGNTDNPNDMLRRYSRPVNGWESVNVEEADSWEIDGDVVAERGVALRFDGYKSPAIAEPSKYPFLIQKAHIEAHLRKVGGNANDPSFCSQVRAVWPAIGIESTVLDLAIIERFNCKGTAIWTNGFRKGAAFDPAFTEGGDRKILQFFRYGLVNDMDGERWVVQFDEWIDVPVDGNSLEPIHYQIKRFVVGACSDRGITYDDFAMDSSGEGGGLKAIFDAEWGRVIGVEFGGSPSDTVIDTHMGVQRTAKDVYDRRVSELNLTLRNFAMSNGIRGLSEEAASEACQRKTFYKNKKNGVESKKDLRARCGKSPDHLDACVVACAFVVERGCSPGNAASAVKSSNKLLETLAKEGAEMLGYEPEFGIYR